MGVELLREGLLEGVRIALAGSPGSPGSHGQAVCAATRRLGAEVRVAPPGAPVGPELDLLVVDGAALFADGGLHDCLAGAWRATQAAANEAFLPAERGGRIVYLAPAPGADRSEILPHADAARAGLENLARTLSVEWARHWITTVTLALGDTTGPDEAAALVAYLASPAAEYFSGCQLDLRGGSEPSTGRTAASSVTRVP